MGVLNTFSVGNLSCNRIYDASDRSGLVVDTGISNTFGVRQYNSANWGIGVTKYFMVSGNLPLT